nr:MAG TPA: hypothetical protein [Caudoviricetes sp.]
MPYCLFNANIECFLDCLSILVVVFVSVLPDLGLSERKRYRGCRKNCTPSLIATVFKNSPGDILGKSLLILS